MFCNEVKVQGTRNLNDVSITDCRNKGSALSPFPDYSFYVSGVFFFLLFYFVCRLLLNYTWFALNNFR